MRTGATVACKSGMSAGILGRVRPEPNYLARNLNGTGIPVLAYPTFYFLQLVLVLAVLVERWTCTGWNICQFFNF